MLVTIPRFCDKTKEVDQQFQPRDRARFEAAISRFDEENAKDPNQEQAGGVAHARELLYAQRLSEWILLLCPNASEELRLAARSQHLRRWAVPRETYPMTRAGYLKWRQDLKHFHADQSGGILRQAGYDTAAIERVQALNLKSGFPHDPESRVLEDALCLVFLEHQFADLARKASDEKLLNALRKT
ncbi:MAG: DUF4202 domain-containing protein, partial [Limisphaerales bacterium]